jgi:hypothetical protein
LIGSSRNFRPQGNLEAAAVTVAGAEETATCNSPTYGKETRTNITDFYLIEANEKALEERPTSACASILTRSMPHDAIHKSLKTNLPFKAEDSTKKQRNIRRRLNPFT